MNSNCYCVILAGGIGSRLWPSSRNKHPKQFLDILGVGKSLLQSTYDRYKKFIPQENIIIVSNEIYKDLVHKQLPELQETNLLLEPIRRNTVPSVTWAAFHLFLKNPDALMLVTPSDQMITDEEAFHRDIMTGFEYIANHKRLLTMGIAPTHPETTYGYIQMSDSLDNDIYKVQSFTEKPNSEFARIFFESKEFLWNTGLYMWSAKTFLDSVGKAYPVLSTRLHEKIAKDKEILSVVDDAFSTCPNVPLETGILEKAENVDVLLCHFSWKDIGTWNQLYDLLSKTDGSNVAVNNNAMFYDCEHCIVKLPDGKVAVLQGLNDLAVIADDNVLMICKKEDQQSIRKFVNDIQLTYGDDFA